MDTDRFQAGRYGRSSRTSLRCEDNTNEEEICVVMSPHEGKGIRYGTVCTLQ